MSMQKVNLLVMMKTKMGFYMIKNIYKEDPLYDVIEINNIRDIYKIISMNIKQRCVIIYESSFDISLAESEITKIKEYNPYVKLLVLSPNSKKDLIIRFIKCGVNNFIIMPFEDVYLKEKILELAKSITIRNIEAVSFNFTKYISGEITKANKGNYDLTLILATIIFPKEEKSILSEYEYEFFLNKISNIMVEISWETDLYFKLHPKHLLGVFPFCNRENSSIIIKRIEDEYNKIIEHNQLPTGYNIVTSCSTFPENASSVDEILNSLAINMKSQNNDTDDVDLVFKGLLNV